MFRSLWPGAGRMGKAAFTKPCKDSATDQILHFCYTLRVVGMKSYTLIEKSIPKRRNNHEVGIKTSQNKAENEEVCGGIV